MQLGFLTYPLLEHFSLLPLKRCRTDLCRALDIGWGKGGWVSGSAAFSNCSASAVDLAIELLKSQTPVRPESIGSLVL